MNIYEPRQCFFDSGASPTGFVLELVSLISMASVVQTHVELASFNHDFYNLATYGMSIKLYCLWFFDLFYFSLDKTGGDTMLIDN